MSGKRRSRDRLALAKQKTPLALRGRPFAILKMGITCTTTTKTMVRIIKLEKLHEISDKEFLGVYPTERDFDEVIDEDCDVYLPDGTLGLTFRKQALKTLRDVESSSPTFKYWRWVSRSLLSDQRGSAAGRELVTNVEIRLTEGQKKFFAAAVKRDLTLSEAQELTTDKTPSRETFYVHKTESDGLVDLDEIEKWDSLVRKKSTSSPLREEAISKRNAAKLAWFDKWLMTTWVKSANRKQAAKDAKKRYVTTQPRGNKAHSAVLGAIDRSGRTPFGRLTKPTMDRYEDFCEQLPLFREIDGLLKETMPNTWKVLSKRFKEVKDESYNLFGTCFTSITTNWNFQVAYHYDGNNAKNAAAALTVLEKGTYEGSEFVFPQLRLAFNLRHGDFLGGDNQGLMHGMMPFKNTSSDFESVWLVFYQRDNIIKLDSLRCEICRREFLDYAVINYPELGTGEKKWAGSFPGMWGSTYWENYKRLRTEEGGYNYEKECTNSNLKGDPDQVPVEVRSPHLKHS
jgi:hypothetical protein